MTAATISPEAADEFRTRAREFLAANTHPGARRDLNPAKEFQGKLAAAGLAGLTYATECGGAGLTLEHERIWRQVAQDFPAMTGELVISHGMCLPVLAEFGTEAQQAKAFIDTAIGLKRRIELMLALPLERLSGLSLQREIDQIGRSGA